VVALTAPLPSTAQPSLTLANAVGNPRWEGITNVTSIGARPDQFFLLLPALVSDRDLWRGVQYFIASLRVFTFMPLDVVDALRERDAVPNSPYATVDAESAVWLAYKAVESIVGDPSSDRRKLQRHLDILGLMDFPGVWRHEAPVDLATRLSRFVTTRDRQAAHGRHHARRKPLTYFEVIDYQYFARNLLERYAEKTLERLHLPRPHF